MSPRLFIKIEMDSDNRQCCQTAIAEADAPECANTWAHDQQSVSRNQLAYTHGYSSLKIESLNQRGQKGMEESTTCTILAQLQSQQLLIVNSRRRNGLILYKRYHAEFAGPGAAVGGLFDKDCQRALPVGDFSLVSPESTNDRQRAYLTRRQWIKLTKQITDNPVPLQRAQKIIEQFEQFFGANTVAQLPDEAFALLVGVFPETIRIARYTERD